MAQALSEITIEATTEVAVSNRDGSIIQPGSTFRVWEEGNPNQNLDVFSGSLKPVALQIPTATVTDYQISKLKVTGKCLFPRDYPRAATCRLVGSIKDAPIGTPVLASKPWPIVLPATNPPSDIQLDIGSSFPGSSSAPGAMEFEMPAIIKDRPCAVPFRLSGDFEWHIECTTQILVNPLKYDKSTRLELFWLTGPALAGPNVVKISFERTELDLSGAYPIQLLRLYLPRPTDLLELVEYEAKHGNFRDWWIKQALARLPSDKFLYNVISGKSNFGMGCCGGSFAFDKFACQALSNKGSPVLPLFINSFDLAALIQLAYSPLVNSNGEVIQYTKWVCKSPFGKIRPSMPFGISKTSVPTVEWPNGVNNPYFGAPGAGHPLENDAEKTSICNARAWIEAYLPFEKEPENVLDISWMVSDGGKDFHPDLRQRDRRCYATTRIEDLSNLGNLSDYLDDTPSTNPQCFANPDFGRLSATKGDTARVGVYDTRNILQPRHSYDAAWLVPMPPKLRKTIDLLISAGMNPSRVPRRFNDASLRTSNVLPVLTASTSLELDSALTMIETDVKVVPGACCVSYVLKNLPVNTLETGKLAVKINVYDSFIDAYEALAFELTKYERDISDIVSVGPDVGQYSLQTPHSVLCVRGNLFIEMTIEALTPVNGTAFAIVNKVMERLDKYLSGRVVDASQIRRPKVAIAGNAPNGALDNSTFAVTMQISDSLATVMSAQTSRGALVVRGQFDATRFVHDFWVMKRLDSELAPTTVTIAGAHSDTFHPGSCIFNVVVGKAAT